MSWKDIIKTVAPVLGTALGGPFGGMATKAIANAVLGDEKASSLPAQDLATEIEAAIANDKEALLRLKEADNAFDAEMKKLDVDIMAIDAADRDSARNMQIKTRSWVVPTLATVTVCAFFAVVFWVLTGKVTLESTLLGFILGQVSSKAEQVYNYFFGSSQGSKDKTDKLAAVK